MIKQGLLYALFTLACTLRSTLSIKTFGLVDWLVWQVNEFPSCQDIFMALQNEIEQLIKYKHFLTDAQKNKILNSVQT